MSKLFNHWYFSAENNYGCEQCNAIEHQRIADMDAEWELYEAEQDLLTGIADNQPHEFIFFTEQQQTA